MKYSIVKISNDTVLGIQYKKFLKIQMRKQV